MLKDLKPYKFFFILKLSLFCTLLSYAQLPSGFQTETLGSNWDFPMGVTFDDSNRMYVWERAGKLFKYQNNSKTLLLDISEEVATYGDFGLLSAALDPNFTTNGYVYLYYIVDRHHLMHFGKPSYSPYVDEQGATIGRLTRYTVNVNNFNSVIPNSRKVLIGSSKSNGFPIVGTYHGGGDIKFSVDGTLLVACGDGILGADYETQAFNDGILSQQEFTLGGRWRCQIPQSLNGKIIRIDPETGNGVSSNPYFETSNPASTQSKVWALGLRNPFRISLKPNSGSHSSSAGQPGTIFLGDVGQETKEEINAVTQAAQNFGWPRFEGFNSIYLNNPPYHPVQHTGPIIEYGRSGDIARVKNNSSIANVGSSTFPYSNFTGGCAIGGVFYEGTKYPEAYRNAYFMAEFNDRWVKAFTFDDANNPKTQINFSPDIVGLIQFAYNPHDECIYYVSFIGGVVRLNYNPQGNQAPKSVFSVNKNHGSSPLTISFDAFESSDPENESLTYHWNFGDGNFASGIRPTHTFVSNSKTSFSVTLTVTDLRGASHSSSQKVSINNTPPQIISTSLDHFDKYVPSNNAYLNLNVNAIDAENSSLTYKWEAYLYHNDHRHLEFSSTQQNTSFLASGIPCDNVLYFYRIYLYVTDPQGLTSTFFKDIYANCNQSDVTPPSDVNLKIEELSEKGFKVIWDPVSDNQAVKFFEININGQPHSFTAANVYNFTYLQDYDILNQNFEIEVLARDFSGNISRSSKIHFSPNQTCEANSQTKTYISTLQELSSTNGLGPIEKDQSNGNSLPNDGNALILNKIKFKRGIGTHANSEIIYAVNGKNFQRFKAIVGLDDQMKNSPCGSVYFRVYKDQTLVFQSPWMNKNSANFAIDVDVNGANFVKLEVYDAGDGNCGDQANWADAHFTSYCNYDNKAPSTPQNFTAISNPNGIALSWAASTDNLSPIVEYEVFVNNVLVQTTTQTQFLIPISQERMYKLKV